MVGDLACGDPPRVGVKSAHLSPLAPDYQVPPGFCLAATAFDPEYLPDAPLTETLAAALATACDDLSRRCDVLDVPVAVRSSLDEDGELTSFAGEHETKLNLLGAKPCSRLSNVAGLRDTTNGRSPTASSLG